MTAVLRNRSLWIIGLAESISATGTWITMMALFALVMFDGQGTVLHASSIMLAGLAPMLLLAPVAGRLADRYDRKRLMIASQLLTALPVVGLMLVGNTLWLYPLLMLHTTFAVVMLPARQASVPQLVPEAELTQANALLQQLTGIIKIGAPVLGGAATALLGPSRAMLLDLITFGVAALVLTRLPALPPLASSATAADQGQTAFPDSVWRVLRRSAPLRLLFIVIFLGVLVIMGFDVLSAVAVRDVLQADERLFGMLIGLVGLGSVLAGLGLMLRKRPVDPWCDVALGLVLLAVLPLSIAAGVRMDDVARIRWLVAGGALIGGLGNGLVIVQVSTLLQRLSPPALLGQLSGVFHSAIAAAQLITILVTPLLVPRLLGLDVYFAWSAFLLVLVVIYTLFMARRRRKQDVALQSHGASDRIDEFAATPTVETPATDASAVRLPAA